MHNFSLQSGVDSPCSCDECQNETQTQSKANNQSSNQSKAKIVMQSQNNGQVQPNMADNIQERAVDVLVHDAPNAPNFFQSVTTPAYHVAGPPPPGFVIAPYQPPRFHTGGNIDDLLGDVQSCPTAIQTTFIQQNSVFMCNMKRIMEKQCCCQKNESPPQPDLPQEETPKCFVTEKNIELTYDYPRTTPIPSSPSQKTSSEMQSTTTEVASTVVFVERRIPVKPKKFDFFFRSRSAPVGENEEPIYATVNKLPKRLRRMELANLEKEVAYRTGEQDSSSRTEVTKTDSESQVPPPDDDTSRSEREKSTIPRRPDSPKAKKRKRFSLTFKKRERKRREKKDTKNGTTKNGVVPIVEGDNERLIEGEVQEVKHKHCTRHRPRNTLSSASSGPRYKRDSYQVHPLTLVDVETHASVHLRTRRHYMKTWAVTRGALSKSSPAFEIPMAYQTIHPVNISYVTLFICVVLYYIILLETHLLLDTTHILTPLFTSQLYDCFTTLIFSYGIGHESV